MEFKLQFNCYNRQPLVKYYTMNYITMDVEPLLTQIFSQSLTFVSCRVGKPMFENTQKGFQ